MSSLGSAPAPSMALTNVGRNPGARLCSKMEFELDIAGNLLDKSDMSCCDAPAPCPFENPSMCGLDPGPADDNDDTEDDGAVIRDGDPTPELTLMLPVVDAIPAPVGAFDGAV
eukprot:TRINITY_DN4406_c0_g1::TRINITY_DN4406_c0_g1_i1::g.7333::m.7333 TRINITY_DN4406_c0_g1::TRINITY_DN4406_c0_g1_i1::g.7333  ORF type:complete len:113 (+),score=23.31 TRINITY_DN4406_c0_g1_i1:116-454(+)